MKSPVLRRRLSVLLLLLIATGSLIACTASGRTTYSGDGARQPTPIRTATPGPSPTATPKPLNKPDPAQAKRLIADGKARFLQSDLVGAEAAFIDAIAADPRELQAYNGLTNVYLYLPQNWQQALDT